MRNEPVHTKQWKMLRRSYRSHEITIAQLCIRLLMFHISLISNWVTKDHFCCVFIARALSALGFCCITPPFMSFLTYRNDPKFSDTQNICCNHSKVWTMCLYHRLMSPNDADGMANSVDPDETAPLGAVWSGSALFAQAYLSENLGSLRYTYDSL